MDYKNEYPRTRTVTISCLVLQSCNRTNEVHKNKWFPKYDAYQLSAYFLFSNLRILGHDVKIRKQYLRFRITNFNRYL